MGFFLRYYFVQDPAGIFDLIEVVGNGTYGQVYKGTKINIFIQCGERGEMGGVISIFFSISEIHAMNHLFYDLVDLFAKFKVI